MFEAVAIPECISADGFQSLRQLDTAQKITLREGITLDGRDARRDRHGGKFFASDECRMTYLHDARGDREAG